MRIPYGLTESQVTKIIDKVLNILAPAMTFGYFTTEDMKQEGYICALDGLERYDGRRNSGKVKCKEERLARFLSVHIRNRLLLVKRKYYFRYEKPKNESRIDEWERNNEVRRNLMHPWDLDDVPDNQLEDGTNFEDEYDNKEWMDSLESKMSDSIRNDFRRMLSGVFISDGRKADVQKVVAELMDGT